MNTSLAMFSSDLFPPPHRNAPPVNEAQREARQATFLSRRGLKVASLFIPVPLLSEPRVLTRANLSGGGSFLCALG